MSRNNEQPKNSHRQSRNLFSKNQTENNHSYQHASSEIKVKLANFYKALETIRSDITDLKTGQNGAKTRACLAHSRHRKEAGRAVMLGAGKESRGAVMEGLGHQITEALPGACKDSVYI